MTDWKGLCVELLAAVEHEYADPPIDRLALSRRVRAALAQPEPAEPTDKELDEALFQALDEYMRQKSPFAGPTDEKQLDRAKARAVLKRWGQ